MSSLRDPDNPTYHPFMGMDRLKPIDIHALLALDIPERQMILDPAIPEKGLAMLYAGRGTGKHSLPSECHMRQQRAQSFLSGRLQSRGGFCIAMERWRPSICVSGSPR